jgi:predicted nucleic acid-binding protein
LILVDASAWIEFLRGTGHPVHLSLADALAGDEDLVITEVIVMELLAGARSASHLRDLRSTLLAFPVLPLRGLADFEEAASIYRACRAAGETIRSLIDCLIAVVAIRASTPILHNDADFEAIARSTDLQLVSVSPG